MSELGLKEYDAIKNLILNGNFSEALTKIKKLEKHDFTKVEYLKVKILKSECLLKQNEFSQALNIAQDVLNECNRIEGIGTGELNEIKIDTIIIIAEAFWLLGRFDEGLGIVKQGEEVLQRLMETQHPGIKPRRAVLILHKGVICLNKGEYELALKCMKKSMSINEELGNREDITKALNGIGAIYMRKGELDQALECFQRSLKLSKELDRKERIASCYINIGVIYKLKGDLDFALENYNQSLTINKELENRREIAIVLNNISLIYKVKGELEKALKYLHQSIEISEVLGNKLFIAHTVSNIGVVLHQKNKLDQAFSYFSQGLALFKELENPIDISEVLFHLVSLSIDLDKIALAHEFLQNLKQFHESENNKIISQRYNIAQALLLKTQARVRSRVKAKELLAEIIDEDVVDHNLTIIALLNIFELLISEISHYGDEEALIEAQMISQDLIRIALDQNNFSLLAEAYWLQAQLLVVQLALNEARLLFSKAQTIADQKGLVRLARKLSKDHDKLLDQLELWKELEKREISLPERFKRLEIANKINHIWKQKEFEGVEEKEEEPVFLLLMLESGIPFYSKKFVSPEKLDEILIAGFISAINSFIQSAFGVSGGIDRIKHKENTILIKKIEHINFCYVYKGESYIALKKLDRFISDLTDSYIWKHILNRKIDFKKTSSEKETVEELVEKNFIISSQS